MTPAPLTRDTSASTANATLVWDLPLRLFHWSLVVTVSLAAITGYVFEDLWLDLHAYVGYALLSLLAFRLVWGFVGSHYSRFGTFPLNRTEAIGHLKQFLRGRSEASTGHTPLGAWMIVVLLGLLAALSLSGLILWGGQENSGPLADFIGYRAGEAFEELHEILANFLMFAIVGHLLGVVVETYIFKHPLIQAMISGEKPLRGGAPKSAPSFWHTLGGAVVFAVVAFAMSYWISTANAATLPSPTVAPAVPLSDYAAQARQQSSAFDGFSADRGQTFFYATPGGGKPETPSCTSCHGDDPRKTGLTRAGKAIAPLAVSVTPSRYTDPAKVEKWFRRNCKSVLGRPCTALEKGDFLTFMQSQ